MGGTLWFRCNMKGAPGRASGCITETSEIPDQHRFYTYLYYSGIMILDCVCIYTCMLSYIHTHTIHTGAYAYTHIYINAFMCIHVYAHTNLRIQFRYHTYIHICTHKYMHYIHTLPAISCYLDIIHTHIHT